MTVSPARKTSLGSYRISQKTVDKFLKYLSLTQHFQFRVSGTRGSEKVVKKIPYVHRWTETYRKSILAKFYKLEEWTKENYSGVVTMFSLTTYGGKSKLNGGSYSRMVKGHDVTIDENFSLLKKSCAKLLDLIRHKHPGINYFWVMENHEDTGYVHRHLVFFHEFTQAEQDSFIELWSRKYQAGSRKHGLKISSKNSNGSIQSIRNYLMGYMSKQFGTGEPWTSAEKLFNAAMWKTKTRMWGCSKELTAVMRKPETVSDVEWDSVELLTPAGEFPVWQREDGEPFPVLDDPDIRDPDDLCPEGYVTKLRWKNWYRTIEMMRADMQVAISYPDDSREARRLRNRSTGW